MERLAASYNHQLRLAPCHRHQLGIKAQRWLPFPNFVPASPFMPGGKYTYSSRLLSH